MKDFCCFFSFRRHRDRRKQGNKKHHLTPTNATRLSNHGEIGESKQHPAMDAASKKMIDTPTNPRTSSGGNKTRVNHGVWRLKDIRFLALSHPSFLEAHIRLQLDVLVVFDVVLTGISNETISIGQPSCISVRCVSGLFCSHRLFFPPIFLIRRCVIARGKRYSEAVAASSSVGVPGRAWNMRLRRARGP